MRVLVLTKRHTSGKDLIEERYGRAYELAAGLSKIGNDVRGVAVDYRNKGPTLRTIPGDRNADIAWESVSVDWNRPWRSYGAVRRLTDQSDPEILWCSGDALQIIMGARIARQARIPVVCDLYDNYEAFWPSRIPGIRWAFIQAVRHAGGVTCVSEPLAARVRNAYQRRGPIQVIENGFDPDLFGNLRRSDIRSDLGYTEEQILIGTTGSLRKRRGIRTLLQAFSEIHEMLPSARLLLAGPLDLRAGIPEGAGVDYLGILPPTKIPRLLKILDVGVICNQDNAFGRYCYPLKFPEMLESGIPIVAANVGALRQIFEGEPFRLYQPRNPESLAEAIIGQIQNPTLPDIKPMTWNTLSRSLDKFLASILTAAA